MLKSSARRRLRASTGSRASAAGPLTRQVFQPLEPRKLLFGDPVFDVGTIDGQNGFHIAGIEANAQLGFSVTALGDVNGDGMADLAIGAPSSGGSFQEGKIYIVFGAEGLGSSGEFDLDSLDGSNGFVIAGVELGGNAGWSVAGAGDVNNDMIADIIIGAPFTNKAYILFGSTNIGAGGLFSLSNVNSSNGVEIIGGVEETIGLSVAGIGDLNNDGYGDVAIGSPINVNNSGVAYVIFGDPAIGSDGPIDVTTLDGFLGLFIPGVSQGDELGWRVSSAGDLNDDGVADLAIGAIESDSGAYGSVYVVFGKTGLGMGSNGRIDLSALDGMNGFAIHGKTMNGFFGFNVSGGGDVNGDMIDDLLVGSATQNAYIIFGRSTIGGVGQFDLDSINGSNGYVATVPADAFVVHAGDLNDDGVADVAIASLGTDEVYVYVGGAGVGSSGTFDATMVDGENGFIVQGVQLGSGLIGQPVSAAKDVNGDMRDDLIIGASAANQSTGEAFVLFGVSITGLSAPTNLIATTLDEMAIELQWRDTTIFEDGFEIERSLDGVSGWMQINLSPPSSGTGGIVIYQDGNLDPETTYYYRVRAYNSVANSAYSNTASAMTQGTPAAPSNLQVATISDTALRLTWNDNSSNEIGFHIYRYIDGEFIFIDSVAAGVATFDDTGLDPGTMYYYIVRAFNDQGESSDSNTGMGTTSGGMVSAPNAPSGLAAMAMSSTEILLTWIDNSGNEDGFIIERATDPSGSWSQIDTVLANQTQYINMGLPANSTYFYRVRAFNSAGNSTASNVAGATTSMSQGGGHSAQFVDSDGDMVTFSLIGVAGSISFTTTGDGGIDTLYVSAAQIGAGTLTVNIVQSQSGDGRIQIGQLQGDISIGDLFVRVANVNFALVDLVGGGAWLCDVNHATLGDVLGGASIGGRVADLTVRDVDTTGGISLCDVFTFRARSIDLGGGFDAHMISNFIVDESASLQLSTDGPQGIGMLRIGGDATLHLSTARVGMLNIVGDAQFTGGSQIDQLGRLKVGSSWLSGTLTVGQLNGKVEIVGNAGASATLNSTGGCIVVCGDSAATFNLDHFARFIVKGDVTGGAVSITDSAGGIVCIKGDFAGGSITTDDGGLWCLKVCGSFEAAASFDSTGELHKAMIRGSLDGSIDVASAFCIVVCGDFGGSLSADAAGVEAVHKFCVKGAASGRFLAVGDVNCIIFDEMNQAEVYVGLPSDWEGGLPGSIGEFVEASVLRKLQVRHATDGATIAAATISNLCLQEIGSSHAFHLAAQEVTRAKMRIEGIFYSLGLNEIFTDLPMLGYLDISQLISL